MERLDETEYPPLGTDEVYRITDFYAYWNIKDLNNPVLKNIKIVGKKKQLISLVGKIGSGKSSLFQAFLKEIPAFKGEF